jgi:hypothetical protein
MNINRLMYSILVYQADRTKENVEERKILLWLSLQAFLTKCIILAHQAERRVCKRVYFLKLPNGIWDDVIINVLSDETITHILLLEATPKSCF